MLPDGGGDVLHPSMDLSNTGGGMADAVNLTGELASLPDSVWALWALTRSTDIAPFVTLVERTSAFDLAGGLKVLGLCREHVPRLERMVRVLELDNRALIMRVDRATYIAAMRESLAQDEAEGVDRARDDSWADVDYEGTSVRRPRRKSRFEERPNPEGDSEWYVYQDSEGDWGVRCERDPVTGFPQEYPPKLNHPQETKRRALAMRNALNAITRSEPEIFNPPEWATGEWLKTISVEAKMLARQRGEHQDTPGAWTSVDAILFWWETEGRARWLSERTPQVPQPEHA